MKQREIRETTIVSNSHTFWQRSKKIFERAHDEVLCFNFPKIHCSWIIILFSIARTRFVTFEKNGRFLLEQPPRHLAKVSCFATARAAVFFTIGEKKGGKKGTSKRAATTLLSQCGHEVDEAFHFHWRTRSGDGKARDAMKIRAYDLPVRSGARDVPRTPPRNTQNANAVVQTGPCLSTRVLRRSRAVLDSLSSPASLSQTCPLISCEVTSCWNDVPRTSRIFCPKIAIFSQFWVYLNIT